MVLQENFRGTIATLCFLVLSIFLLLAMVASTSSVIKTDQIVGTIESATAGPLNPKASIGRGFYYQYSVRLHNDGLLVLVRGDIKRPLRLGHHVLIDRQYWQNGRITYRLSGPAGFGL
ncbi:hypothetical protein [Mesorhizobium sp. WSM2239]|uniref:DUF3592 domain-containing protein n=2 Tax=unclassified Mesorhizobium TaxID=325217 RepID=A0AAU8DAK1_9HYPH